MKGGICFPPKMTLQKQPTIKNIQVCRIFVQLWCDYQYKKTCGLFKHKKTGVQSSPPFIWVSFIMCMYVTVFFFFPLGEKFSPLDKNL